MSTESDRDQSVDRLLTAELRRAGTGDLSPVSPACVDAETLAAWSEGTLPSAQALAVESHLSDCARCQAMLAVFARSEPAAAAVVVPFRRAWSVRWMVPLAAGTLAATLLIWTAWPKAPAAPAPAQTMARMEGRGGVAPAAEAPSAPPAATADLANEKLAKDIKAEQKVEQNKEGRALARPDVGTSSTPSIPTSSPTRVPAQPVPLSSPTAPPPASTKTAAATGQVQQRPAGQAAANAAPVFRAGAQDAVVLVVAEFASPDPSLQSGTGGAVGGVAGGRGGGGGGGGGGRGGAAGAASVAARGGTVRPPATPVRWRVFASGAVERSLTAGASWEPVTIDPPDLKISAGVAPSPLVCWLVGRAGVVLRSEDGRTFYRVTFPEAVDLASIRATSARDATVTTVDGRVYVTTDGGLTWRLGSGLGF